MPPTVLHVSESMLGGVGAVIRDLACAQQQAGWRVSVAAPDDPQVPGVTAHRWTPGARPGPALPATLAQLHRIVQRERPQLVHLHSSMAGMCGRLVVRRRIPTLFQPHAWSFFALTGVVRRAALAWERVGAHWADVVLCVSESERAAGVAAGIRPQRYALVANGVDLRRFHPMDQGDARRRLGLGADPLAVCIGRLHRQKGQHALLDAWPAVLRAVPSARLALVGAGPDRAALEARLPPATTFVGSTEAVVDWIAAADVAVQPSVWEGMSLSVLESMSGARPVVATDVPGMAELVRPGTGALVAPGDRHALADAMVLRLTDPALAAREGLLARRLVEEHHDVERQRARVLLLAAEVAGR